MLLDAQRRQDIADRIKRLREEAHLTQPAVAERIGVSLRAYQRVEATGGIKWENLKKLAEVHDVSPDWILQGDSPDLIGSLNGNLPAGVQEQLDRIEKKLDELLKRDGDAAPIPKSPPPLPKAPPSPPAEAEPRRRQARRRRAS